MNNKLLELWHEVKEDLTKQVAKIKKEKEAGVPPAFAKQNKKGGLASDLDLKGKLS